MNEVREVLERIKARTAIKGMNLIEDEIEGLIEEGVEPVVALWMVRGEVKAIQTAKAVIQDAINKTAGTSDLAERYKTE